MSLRSFVGVIAALLLAAGLGGVVWPVNVDGPKGDWLRCADGGFAASVPVTDTTQAGVLSYNAMGELVGPAEYIADGRGEVYPAAPWESNCAQALNLRKLWSAPALVVGGVTLVGVLLVRRKPEAARDY